MLFDFKRYSHRTSAHRQTHRREIGWYHLTLMIFDSGFFAAKYFDMNFHRTNTTDFLATYLSAALLGMIFSFSTFAQNPPAPRDDAPTPQQTPAARNEFQDIAQLPLAERIPALMALTRDADAEKRARARELLVVTRARLGDERLVAGDVREGVEQFRRALADAPAPIPERLFMEVVARFPANLYLRGEQAAALDIAREIERRASDNPARLLTLATFHLSIESPDEAARLALAATRLKPDDATAYIALGAAERLRLQLDPSIAAYRKALELATAAQTTQADAQPNAQPNVQPNVQASARRSLADVLRASGAAEEALALYRALLDADATDALARTGVVLALFDAGKREEAERELAVALAPSNGSAQSAPVVEESSQSSQSAQAAPPASTAPLALLVGAAYWYATQAEGKRALELADLAVAAEPRYTWAHIARARALLVLRRPAEAELTLRAARAYGDFPTLTYELAGALVALGLYDEAAAELARHFRLVADKQIAANLAGRTPTQAADFNSLLAPERRAAILQPRAAASSTEDDTLRRLLIINTALDPDLSPAVTRARVSAKSKTRFATRAAANAAQLTDTDLFDAADAFATGDDDMRFFRQLYILERLLDESTRLARSPVADKYDRLLAIAEAMPARLDAALAAPAAAHATLAAELRDPRRRQLAAGAAPPAAPVVETRKLSVILRGRVEIVAGRLLLNAGRAEEAGMRLQRAVSILPPATEWRRTAHYYLGGALEATGKKPEALDAYIQSYDSQRPNNLRRLVIETIYRQVNGSLDGLDAKLQNAGR